MTVAQRQGRAQVGPCPACGLGFIEIVAGIPVGVDPEAAVLLQVVVAAGHSPGQHPFRRLSGPPDPGNAQDREEGLLFVGLLAFLGQSILVGVGWGHQHVERRQTRADFQGKTLLPGQGMVQSDPCRLRCILGKGGKDCAQEDNQGKEARLHS